jgi:hypothetical protein
MVGAGPGRRPKVYNRRDGATAYLKKIGIAKDAYDQHIAENHGIEPLRMGAGRGGRSSHRHCPPRGSSLHVWSDTRRSERTPGWSGTSPFFLKRIPPPHSTWHPTRQWCWRPAHATDRLQSPQIWPARRRAHNLGSADIHFLVRRSGHPLRPRNSAAPSLLQVPAAVGVAVPLAKRPHGVAWTHGYRSPLFKHRLAISPDGTTTGACRAEHVTEAGGLEYVGGRDASPRRWAPPYRPVLAPLCSPRRLPP